MMVNENTKIWGFHTAGANRAASTYQQVMKQPNWVVKAATLTFLLVIGIPILLLVIVAVLFAGVVFFVLSGINSIKRRLSGHSDESGRENVRIIRRDDL